MIKAEIIADSINVVNKRRLTTFVLEFPRWILAEINTHRMLTRSVASSRAIPIEKMIDMVTNNPAMPEFWGKNQTGMQSKEELIGEALETAKRIWLESRDRAVNSAKALHVAGLHKQYVNRTIENFMYVRAIVSGTEFENFFALRAHSDAQPEFRVLAYLMLEKYNESQPKQLLPGEWHVPFGDKIDIKRLYDLMGSQEYIDYVKPKEDLKNFDLTELKLKISVARSARVSYLNFEGKDDYFADIKLCDRLFGSVPRHLSPTENCAQAIEDDIFIGNFRGWKQYRKFFIDENLGDVRVKK